MDSKRFSVVVCGGGSGAHVAAAFLGQPRHRIDVRILSFTSADKLRAAGVETRGITAVVTCQESPPITAITSGMVTRVSSDPADVVPGADLILVALPSQFHRQVLQAVAPHVKDGASIGNLQASSTFGLMVREAMAAANASHRRLSAVWGLMCLPYACRVTTPGTVNLMNTKATANVCVLPASQRPVVVDILQSFLNLQGCALHMRRSFFSLAMSSHVIAHTSISYGRWHAWDGEETFLEAPKFYHGVDDFTAELLESGDSEVKAVCKAANKQSKSILQANHPSIREIQVAMYSDLLGDTSSIKGALTTNSLYSWVTHPMKPAPDGTDRVVPDFEHRFVAEDVPALLVPLCGWGRILGVPTPRSDWVLEGLQRLMGKEWLVDGELTGKDMADTACHAPQTFGVTSIQDDVELAFEFEANPALTSTTALPSVNSPKVAEPVLELIRSLSLAASMSFASDADSGILSRAGSLSRSESLATAVPVA
mmetsp:Transcript_14666/g.41244  ORF Transcript_14666/g.41244 Transcript_14666/m.41244 type:complete len:483 (+) Transcript_14666:211-1659(+)|eukprot:CAMPEP_0117668158 /NCGR_PEP_ID=MMETSP0804-20121206/11381_1 /TAXON_ID=1074897 /ORGANISM="Tetraselmis astigmatica, Strain CCMP880" /LENGTH=482 /DNA_ID=CAMNT_0005475993 /DNA_START=209 /DNA_END=1657 /DNA_ORIENTATION=+